MKRILTFVLAIIVLCGMVLPICAIGNGATPYYNNTARATARFNIGETGEAVITLSYSGYTTCTTGATITSKIQKLVSGDWVDVNGASWIDECEEVRKTVQHTKQLTSTGTYQLVYEFEVRGTGGDADIINGTIEDTY